MSKDSKQTRTDLQMTFLGTGDKGLRALVTVLNHTKVFQATLKPEEVEARNAGMRIIYDTVGGSQTKLVGALLKGLGAEYEDYKQETRRDSMNKDDEGDK